LIYSAEMGSIFFQIIIFWLISTFFSKNKKNGKIKKTGYLQSIIKGFVNNITEKIENSINELDIVTDESSQFQSENIPNTNKSIKPQNLQVIKQRPISEINLKSKTQKRNRFGLHTKSTLKNAIILNEIIGKPVSLRK